MANHLLQQVINDRKRSGPARHQPQAEPAGFSFAALVRSQLRDPLIELAPDEGLRERRMIDAATALVPKQYRRDGLMLPMAATAAPLLQNPAASEIERVVRPETVLEALGAQRRTLPQGWDSRASVVPTRVASGWSDPTTGVETLTSETVLGASFAKPREVSAHVEMSRRLLRSGREAEALLRDAISEAVGSEIERASIAGSGKQGQPLGLAFVHETGASGATAMAGATATYAETLGALQAVIDNGARLRRCAFLLPDADAEGYLAAAGASGEPMLREAGDGFYTLAGRPAAFSPFLPSGYLIAGEFGQVRMTWQGAPFVMVNPYTQAHKGITKLSIYDCFDCTVARPSFLHTLTPA